MYLAYKVHVENRGLPDNPTSVRVVRCARRADPQGNGGYRPGPLSYVCSAHELVHVG
jgi:hypothetical protein